MNIARRRAVLEGIIAGEDATPTDRLRAVAELRELDREEQEARFHVEIPTPLVERDPNRIETVLRLALLYVGPELIEARAREIADERRLRVATGSAAD